MAETLEILKAKRDELAREQELSRVIHDLAVLESINRWVPPEVLPEEWGQPINRQEMLNDLSWGFPCGFIDDINTRKDGDYRPIFENEIQHAQIRFRCRLICDEIPSAIGALRNLVNYVIGTRWAYEVNPRQGMDDEKRLAKIIQGVVDQILETNAWVGGRDRETFRRTIRDGDSFTRIKLNPQGIPLFRFIEPAQITEPANARQLEDWLGIADRVVSSWKYGVHTDCEDHATPLGYHVVYNADGTSWDYLEPSDLHHIKVGTDEGVKRGLSEFYPVRNHFPRAEKVFSMTADGAAVQASIAGVRQFEQGVKASDVTALNSGVRTATRRQPTQFGGRELDVVSHDRPQVVSARGYTWETGPMGSQRNPNLLLAGQAVLRLVGARWNMPEWMTSGDASNNNLASSLVAESPFVKAAEQEQDFYGREFTELIWKGVAAYLRAHPIEGVGSITELRRILKIETIPVVISARDGLKQAQENQALQAMGVKSRRTIAAEVNLDYDAEIAQMAQEPPLPGSTPTAPPALSGAVEGLLGAERTPEVLKGIIRDISENWNG